jgi:hypothetical protein
MSLINTPTVVTSAGTKSILNVAWDAYQTSDRDIDTKLYTDGSSLYTAISTAVSAGTETFKSVDGPVVGDAYDTTYYYTDTEVQRPLVGQQRNTVVITAPAINAGRLYDTNFNLANKNHFVLVVKSSGTSVAGKVKIRSTASNESVCAFTTSATANTWERKIFDFKVSGSTGVTFTGTPNFAVVCDVEITLDVASNVEVALLYFVDSYEQIIGNVLKTRINCVSEYGIERSVDQADLICRQQVERSTISKKSLEIKVSTKKQDLATKGLGMGTQVINRTAYIIETVNSTNVGAKTISAGAITLNVGADLDIIDMVLIDGNRLISYDSATNVPVNGYHYNTSSGVWTFNTLRNGKIPTITVNNALSLPSVQDKELYDGYTGPLRLELSVNDVKVKQYLAKKAKLTFSDTAINEDFDQENYSFKVYRDNDGVYMTEFLQA